jgi:protein SCO1/2
MLSAVGIDEHLGDPLPLDLAFRDQSGRPVRLRELVDGKNPVILSLAWYDCPMLCGLVLSGVLDSVRRLHRDPDRLRLLTISFDRRDQPDNAAKRQQAVLGRTGDQGLATRWPFLVGGQPEIDALTRALGVRVAFDERTKQFAHPSAIFVLTPEGRISRYLYGVSYPVKDLNLALLEAEAGRSGSSFERLLLTCFHYDPSTRRYGPWLVGFFRAGSALILFMVTLVLLRLHRREREGRS